MMNSFIKTGMLLLLWLMTMAMDGKPSDPVTLPAAEEKLKTMFSRISGTNPDNENKLITDTLIRVMESALNLPGSFEYPFEQLKSVGKITSLDQKLRIITWNLPLADGTNRYFGFLLVKPDKNNPVKIYTLTDRSDDISEPTLRELAPENWYGCLVYGMVEKKMAGTTYYTLLGYDPADFFISRRVVDVLWLTESQQPVFGKSIFLLNKKMQSRILFEYSDQVQMSLQWNENMNMLIFDHLSPSKPSYTGNYQYYGPDFTYDGLRFDKGIWVLVENVDIRNN